MASEVLTNIATSMKDVESKISEGEELIKALKEAGEDVSAMEVSMRELKARKEKWARMLKNRGM